MALCGVLIAQVGSLLVPPSVLPGWLGTAFFSNIVCVLAALVLADRARTHPAERAWVIPFCVGVCLFIVGVNLFLLLAATAGEGMLRS